MVNNQYQQLWPTLDHKFIVNMTLAPFGRNTTYHKMIMWYFLNNMILLLYIVPQWAPPQWVDQ